MKTVKDLALKGKRVLSRVDFNVPLDEAGNITSDKRIVAALPTIKYILEQGASLVLMSHLGEPKEGPDPKLSLAPAAKRLSELLGKPVAMLPDCVGPEVEKRVAAMKPGDVALLENLRFNKGEKKNSPDFAKQLAALGNVYVNDAFGTAHRPHASVEAVPRLFKERAAGFLMEKEIKYLSGALDEPKRPFVAVIGGAKVSSKIAVLENLIAKVDALLIGGAMAYTFLKAQGHAVGASLVEDDKLEVAGEILKKAKAEEITFLLPVDHVCGDRFAEDAVVTVTKGVDIPDGLIGLDIGPKTLERYAKELKSAGTVVWNGPVGAFEMKPFAKGTFELAKVLAGSGAVSVLGGGDTASAAKKAGVDGKMTHVSTGGGASLEFLEGKVLPGFEALGD